MVDVEKIKELVERFERNLDAYRSGKYKEEQLRLEFINPFFQTLGWDVDNEQGYAEAYKEVIHEDSIRIGGATKAPDYCFRIGGTRKFFVEAKKPSVDIKENIHPAYQLRRYAWSAKLPLSILTDFEEFAVYDCRIKPAKTDKASAARILYIEYSDYLKRWDEIASIFSKEAVLKGSFDKYVESTKLKRGTAEVDDAFLAEIEQWRDELARNIALRNPKLSTRQLNFAVQKTIDRIIFLRICEDRGIEGYGQLQALLNGTNVYQRLTQLFRDADDRYNSGLFHFREEKGREEPPDDLTLNLTIDNDKLKRIIKDIYYPDSPYEFSVLPADILGHVYEQFLGKVIRLTKGHQAKIDWKPEVKKAHGVYYTPTYIVAYIVKNTVGKLCEGKTPAQAAKLRILDPACGSGSFLLGAYQYLLDWHRDYYIAEGPGKHKKKLYQVTDKEWRLATEERKRILLNNIYGVDIDPQAVEVTKLSLLLKVLEGESEETLKRQLAIFHQRALPDLGANIKCGNSLIGSDFYANRQTDMFDDEEQYRINAFDWEVEFPEIFPSPSGRGTKGEGAGGFDAVIGNPPYVNIRILTQIQGKIVKQYFKARYTCAFKGYDLYVLFIDKSFDLLREQGFFGMIIPNKIGALDYALKIRELILSKTEITKLLDVSNLKVFGTAIGVYPYVLIYKKERPNNKHSIEVLIAEVVADISVEGKYKHIKQNKFDPEIGLTIHGGLDVESKVSIVPLSMICKLHSGTTGFSASKIAGFLKEKAAFKGKAYDFIVSGNVDRYSIIMGNLRYMKRDYEMPVLPIAGSDLTKNKKKLYSSEKIIIAGMTKILEATYDKGGFALGVGVYAASEIDNNPLYVLGLLNSNLMTYIFRKRFEAKHLAGGYLAINKGQLEQLPIRTIDFDDPEDKAKHDKMVKLVERMLDLNKKLAEAKVPDTKKRLQRQITATDTEIDKLVYELYDLTEEEIRIVESSI